MPVVAAAVTMEQVAPAEPQVAAVAAGITGPVVKALPTAAAVAADSMERVALVPTIMAHNLQVAEADTVTVPEEAQVTVTPQAMVPVVAVAGWILEMATVAPMGLMAEKVPVPTASS